MTQTALSLKIGEPKIESEGLGEGLRPQTSTLPVAEVENAPNHRPLLSLLGPLVPPLLRSADGSLDLSKIPTGSFEEFKGFLITQVKPDGIGFNEYLLDSYHKILAKGEYHPLLEELYVATKGLSRVSSQNGGMSELAMESLARRFTSEIISVSAQKFVSAHIQSEPGRERIRSILLDKEHYTKGIRSDLAKAIALVGYEMGGSLREFQEFNREISVMNYGNMAVSDTELEAASKLADGMLNGVGRLQEGAAQLEGKYLQSPGEVRRFAGLERELGRKISDGEIQERAQEYQAKQGQLDLVSQLQAKLSHLWLTIVDDAHWKDSNPYKTARNGAFLFKQTEALIKQGEQIHNEAELLQWSESIRSFLDGGLEVTGTGLRRDLADFFAPATVSQMMRPIDQAHRAAYDELRQLSDEIHHGSDMGEKFELGNRGEPKDRPLDQVKAQFTSGLQQAKRSLWYSYKQHKLLSRTTSQVASWFNSGDIPEIRAGEKALDQLIQQVEAAQGPQQIQGAVQELQNQLKENGAIQLAIRASEMEGNEQLLGLAQTILILMATRGIYRTLSPLKGTQAVAQVATETALSSETTLTQRIIQGAKAYPMSSAKAFGLGTYISASENAVAVASGEVRQGGEHWTNWAKDSAATGASMALLAPISTYFGAHSASESLIQRMGLRYFVGGWRTLADVGKGLAHIGGDAAVETVEELSDNYFRANLDDSNAAIGFDQAREVAMVSTMGGGFTKMGVIGEMLRGPRAVQQGPRSGGNGVKRSEIVEGSESLIPPSFLPKSSGRSLFDLGFLQSVMTAPTKWFYQNQTLLSQVLLTSIVGIGIPPGPGGDGAGKSILNRILKGKISNGKKLQILEKYRSDLQSAEEGTLIVSQALAEMPQLFKLRNDSVRRSAMDCFFVAASKISSSDSQVGSLLAQMEVWKKNNFFPKEFHEPLESQIKRLWVEHAKKDFKTLMVLENLAVAGNYQAAEALFELAKKEEEGNDVYAVQSLLRVGRAGYDYAWEMLASLAENSESIILELQLEARERQNAKALSALQLAGEKNPKAKAAAEVVSRIDRYAKKNGGVSKPSDVMGIGLVNFFQQQNSDETTSTIDWFSNLTPSQKIIAGVILIAGGVLAHILIQDRKRNVLVERALQGDEEAYGKIYDQAAAGDRKALAALAKVAEQNPEAALDLANFFSSSKYPANIRHHFISLNTQTLMNLAMARNPVALQALLVAAEQGNIQAQAQLKGMKLYDFLKAEGHLPFRASLLEKIVTRYGNESAKAALLKAHLKFEWAGFEQDPDLWRAAYFFARMGFSRELKEIQTRDLSSIWSKMDKKLRLPFFREVLIPSALMGNQSSQNILQKINPIDLPLPRNWNKRRVKFLTVLAEWENDFAWSELERGVESNDLAIEAVAHLSRYGYSRADSILGNFDVQILEDRIFQNPEHIRGAVLMDLWGHRGAKKLLRKLSQYDSALEERINQCRGSIQGHETSHSIASELDREFQQFIQNYPQLPPDPRNHLREKVLQAWLALPSMEKVEAYMESQRTLGEFTSLPIPFILKKAREVGFHTLGLKDLAARQRERLPLGNSVGSQEWTEPFHS